MPAPVKNLRYNLHLGAWPPLLSRVLPVKEGCCVNEQTDTHEILPQLRMQHSSSHSGERAWEVTGDERNTSHTIGRVHQRHRRQQRNAGIICKATLDRQDLFHSSFWLFFSCLFSTLPHPYYSVLFFFPRLPFFFLYINEYFKHVWWAFKLSRLHRKGLKEARRVALEHVRRWRDHTKLISNSASIPYSAGDARLYKWVGRNRKTTASSCERFDCSNLRWKQKKNKNSPREVEKNFLLLTTKHIVRLIIEKPRDRGNLIDTGGSPDRSLREEKKKEKCNTTLRFAQ